MRRDWRGEKMKGKLSSKGSILSTRGIGLTGSTSTAYPHIQLHGQVTGTAPYLPGPAMLQEKQDIACIIIFIYILATN